MYQIIDFGGYNILIDNVPLSSVSFKEPCYLPKDRTIYFDGLPPGKEEEEFCRLLAVDKRLLTPSITNIEEFNFSTNSIDQFQYIVNSMRERRDELEEIFPKIDWQQIYQKPDPFDLLDVARVVGIDLDISLDIFGNLHFKKGSLLELTDLYITVNRFVKQLDLEGNLTTIVKKINQELNE